MLTYTRAMDSLLCVPLMIDVAAWCAAFARRARRPAAAARATAYLFKVPEGAALGVDPGFFAQMRALTRRRAARARRAGRALAHAPCARTPRTGAVGDRRRESGGSHAPGCMPRPPAAAREALAGRSRGRAHVRAHRAVRGRLRAAAAGAPRAARARGVHRARGRRRAAPAGGCCAPTGNPLPPSASSARRVRWARRAAGAGGVGRGARAETARAAASSSSRRTTRSRPPRCSARSRGGTRRAAAAAARPAHAAPRCARSTLATAPSRTAARRSRPCCAPRRGSAPRSSRRAPSRRARCLAWTSTARTRRTTTTTRAPGRGAARGGLAPATTPRPPRSVRRGRAPGRRRARARRRGDHGLLRALRRRAPALRAVVLLCAGEDGCSISAA